MNYYPTNFYSSYPYQGQYMQSQNQMQPYAQPPQTMMPAPQTSQGLSGKIVDSFDVARVADIPFGGYGIFPKADLSEIYVKTWNNNGTTSMLTFYPMVDASSSESGSSNSEQQSGGCNKEEHKQLMAKINQLEAKISEILSLETKQQEELKQQSQQPTVAKRKELDASAY